MRVIGIADLKANLSKQLAAVKAGEEIVVTERGGPIARIVPISAVELPDRVRRLAQQGLVKAPSEPLEPWEPGARVQDPEGHLLRAVLDERDAGR